MAVKERGEVGAVVGDEMVVLAVPIGALREICEQCPKPLETLSSLVTPGWVYRDVEHVLSVALKHGGCGGWTFERLAADLGVVACVEHAARALAAGLGVDLDAEPSPEKKADAAAEPTGSTLVN